MHDASGMPPPRQQLKSLWKVRTASTATSKPGAPTARLHFELSAQLRRSFSLLDPMVVVIGPSPHSRIRGPSASAARKGQRPKRTTKRRRAPTNARCPFRPLLDPVPRSIDALNASSHAAIAILPTVWIVAAWLVVPARNHAIPPTQALTSLIEPLVPSVRLHRGLRLPLRCSIKPALFKLKGCRGLFAD